MALGMSIGLRALLSAKTVMEVIGHNLANQNTPGYSRQVALLQTSYPVTGPKLIHLGTGVMVGDVYSVRNEMLLSRIRAELGGAGRYATETEGLSQLESILGDLSENGIATKMQSVFDAADAAATKPEDLVLRQNLLTSLSELTLGFRTRDAAIEDQRRTSLLQANSLVAQANSQLAQIANLNTKITSQVTLGVMPNDLLDQRNVLLESLAENLGATSIPLEDGSVAVSVAGVTLVTGATAIPLKTTLDGTGALHLLAGKGNLEVHATKGRLGALVTLGADYLPDRLADLDRIARALIHEVNSIHAGGVPATGPFQQLKSAYAVEMQSGSPLGKTLGALGLPFDIQDGTLTIAVTDLATSDVTHHEIAIDPDVDTLQGFLNSINGIPGMSAFLDGAGKLTMQADPGYGFDFSQKLDPNPVEGGTFGAGNAVLSTEAFPANLAPGSTLQIAVDGGAPQTVTFNAVDFADITQATASEVAAVINAQVAGVSASVVDGRLVIGSNTAGALSSLAVTDGTGAPAAALGLPLAAAGSDTTVEVQVTGSSATAGPDVFTFQPTGDGQIGVTPGLGIEVYDQNGALLTTLAVGEGYEPGDPLEVVEGVFVSFGPGTVQGSSGQFFDLKIPGDTDTADVLPAFGLNALLVGEDAATIDVASHMKDNPQALSGALTGGAGDGANFLALAGLSTKMVDSLEGSSLLHAYNGFAAEVGAASAGAQQSLQSTGLVLLTLETQRLSQSGVSPDEELLNLERFQDAYEAAARYLSVMTDLDDVLLQL